jgi:hypothetical protein
MSKMLVNRFVLISINHFINSILSGQHKINYIVLLYLRQLSFQNYYISDFLQGDIII